MTRHREEITTKLLDNPRQQLVELDEEVEMLKQRLDEAAVNFPRALDEVSSRPEVDDSIEKRLVETSDRLKAMQPKIQDLDFDVAQQAALWGSILEVDQAVNSDGEDLDRFEKILLGVERVRQVIRDALDEFTGGSEPSRSALINEIKSQLPDITQVRLAEILDVTPRTVGRWTGDSGRPSRRLALTAKLIKVLRHAWTPAGAVAWLERPRDRLDGKAPLDVIDDPAYEQSLLAEARGSRNQYGT